MAVDSARGALDFVSQLARGVLPEESAAQALIKRAGRHLAALGSLVPVHVPAGACLHVVGDLHGQLPDLLHVLAVCGAPAGGRNLLLFNGDFVDRGPRSVEVMLALFALLLGAPDAVFLNRGNHETRAMNRVYGFEHEVLRKYSRETFEIFQEAFAQLPLAALANESVLVLHGGLPAEDKVTLADLAALPRSGDPRGLAHDLLWADPQPQDGRAPSPRGGGIQLFGPDVTSRFCDENSLLCCIRSHEVVMAGCAWQRGQRCLTVFSASNYVGRAGNKGAVCHIRPPQGGRIQAPDLSFTHYTGEDVLASWPLSRPPAQRSRL